MNFGEKIVFIRRVKGLTQSKLAEMAGVSAPYLNHIENGKQTLDAIGENIISRLAEALGTSAEELKSPNKPTIAGYTPDEITNVPKSATKAAIISPEAAFEAERRGWNDLEASLRDTIARQQATIDFLMEIIRSSRSSSIDN